MHYHITKRAAARFVFIIGFLLMFLGSAFIIESLTNVSRVSILISFLLLILGISCAIFAVQLNWRSTYLFFAALFLQTGLALFLYSIHIIPIKLSNAWPLLSVFAGIALIPAGWHRYGVIKVNYIVPAVAFIIMGAALMIFALDLVPVSLTQFVIDWWPLFVVLAGLILVMTSLATKFSSEMKK
jgi:hypothetical protein